MSTTPSLPPTNRYRPGRSLLQHLKKGRLLELGCGHGMYSILAQQLGWSVTAVDARDARMPKTPGINWVVADVRDYEITPHDCIAVFGLFYHLTFDDQVSLLRRSGHSITVIDTHFALRRAPQRWGLSKEVCYELDGETYSGKLYPEAKGRTIEEQQTSCNGSAWFNRESFWPYERDLLRMIAHVGGYKSVFKEQFQGAKDRAWFLCLP